MEILTQFGTSILSAIGEELVKSASRRIKYLFRFRSIVEDLSEEARNLRSRLEDMQHRIDRAKTNTEEIEEDVQRWVEDVMDVVADVENTERKGREKQSCLYWKQRYQLAKNAERKKEKVLKLIDEGKFETISHRAPLLGGNLNSSEEFVPYESNQRTYNKVIEALKDGKANPVGLYGMGGVGKTTLAKAVASKAKEDNMFKKVLMVVVSQNPNIRGIQGQIADFFSLELREESEQGRAERLSMRLRAEKENILIILDDVWTKLDLNVVGIPVERCKVFITTRRLQVCINMACQVRILLEALAGEEGLLLLKRQAGLKDDFPTLNQLVEEVAKECKGLPLAIVTVGSALREKTADEWKTMVQKLKKSRLVKVENVDLEVYNVIKWSYDYLKSEETKLCFLLCSLFPEDHKINVEELFRYGYGLGWYQDTDSIDGARTEVHTTVNNLKASSLLLDEKEGFVKMHDIVRDVALWIASKGEHVFLVKAGLGLTEWPKHLSLEHCTVISLIGNEIKVLPDDLVCPRLLILLLGSYSSKHAQLEIGENFLKGMKDLKVVTLVKVQLSLKSFESLSHLVTLQLIGCEIQDAFFLKKLAELEILSLQNSQLDGCMKELKELNRLRILDLRNCLSMILEKIPSDVIPRLSRLEQLYIYSDLYHHTTSRYATLAELNELSCLTLLSLSIMSSRFFGSRRLKDFYLVKNLQLVKYEIAVNDYFNLFYNYPRSYPDSRKLAISHSEGDSLFAFKSLYKNVKYLVLHAIDGCPHNIVPCIDQAGLVELKSLELLEVKGLECIVDMIEQHVPSTAFSHLVDLRLTSVDDLTEFCKGGNPPCGFFGSLETLKIQTCRKIKSCLFPPYLCQKLGKLKDLAIADCFDLEHVFQLQEGNKENPLLLASLSSLSLAYLSLHSIWKGPTQQLSLQKLTSIDVQACHKLRYIFPLDIARRLTQLRELSVSYCSRLEHIVEIQVEESTSIASRDGNDVVLPRLRLLQLVSLENLINFCSDKYTSTWPALEQLELAGLKWTQSLVAELEANIQTVPDLRIVVTEIPNISQVYRVSRNLVTLAIAACTAKVVFEEELSLPHLKELVLANMDELECIYKGPSQLLSLPNLQALEVHGCKRLKSLLPLSLAWNLEKIKIVDCRKLEYIFEHKSESDSELELTFPRLKKLVLRELKGPVFFCSFNYHSIFPCLIKLKLEFCSNISKNFSVDGNRSVHWQAKAPSGVDLEHSSPSTTDYISCHSSMEIQETLPPYIGR